jgi:transposase-like protein
MLPFRSPRPNSLRFRPVTALLLGLCWCIAQAMPAGASVPSLYLVQNSGWMEPLPIQIRQVKYLNNIVEQDHRAIKRLVRPMLGFKSFWSAAVTLTGIELMHMDRKGQLLLTAELSPVQRVHPLGE